MKEQDTEIFDSLSTFIKALVYESNYFVEVESSLILTPKQGETDPLKLRQLYSLAEYKEYLQNQDGLYTSVALIINFFLSYPKKIGLQQTVLTIFRRLYSSFHSFRKSLEDPIIMVLINIQHKFNENEIQKQTRSRADTGIEEDQLIEQTYGMASKFVNYLLQSDDTEAGFKEKIFGRKELQQYLTSKNLESYKPNPKCLPLSIYG